MSARQGPPPQSGGVIGLPEHLTKKFEEDEEEAMLRELKEREARTDRQASYRPCVPCIGLVVFVVDDFGTTGTNKRSDPNPYSRTPGDKLHDMQIRHSREISQLLLSVCEQLLGWDGLEALYAGFAAGRDTFSLPWAGRCKMSLPTECFKNIAGSSFSAASVLRVGQSWLGGGNLAPHRIPHAL